MATTAAKVTYKAVFERTVFKQVKGKSAQVLLSFEDPEDKTFKEIVDAGDRGYLTIFGPDGELVHGFETSAQNAQAKMRSCLKGSYDPFPAIKLTKAQELGSPRDVK